MHLFLYNDIAEVVHIIVVNDQEMLF